MVEHGMCMLFVVYVHTMKMGVEQNDDGTYIVTHLFNPPTFQPTQAVMGDTLMLPPVNPYQRALQYQTLEQDVFGVQPHPSFYVQKVDNGRPALLLTRADPETVVARTEELRQARLDAIANAAGFSVVWDMLRKANKPAVGHNCMLDVAYTLASFAQGLPGTWEDYKVCVWWWPSCGCAMHKAHHNPCCTHSPHTLCVT